MSRFKTLLVVLAPLIVATCVAPRLMFAGDGCCAKCGCQCEPTRVCRVIEDERKVSVVCWGMEEEPVCVPGRSIRGCKNCEDVCESDGCCLHGCPRKLVWRDWLPGNCAKIYTHKKLMKKTVAKTVPAFEWVVADVCPQCAAK